MGKPQKKDQEGAPAWMVTFADMMTLLLCFFVILFSMSQIRIIKFGAVASTLKSALRGVPDAPQARRRLIPDSRNKGAILPNPGVSGRRNPTPDVGRRKGSPGSGGSAERAGQPSATRKLIEASGLDEFAGLVNIQEDNEYLKIRIQGDLTFKSGRATMNVQPGGELAEILTRLAMVLRWVPNRVLVFGHTDEQAVHSRIFPSNWELSAARAASVVRHMSTQYHLDEERFSVIGKAHTSPVVVPVNAAARAKNRRVEFWIRKKGATTEGI